MIRKIAIFLNLLFLLFFLSGANAFRENPFNKSQLKAGNYIMASDKVLSNILPGVYLLNITSSISSGTSAKFVVYSSAGLAVKVDTSIIISNTSFVPVTWTPIAGIEFNATVVLKSIDPPSWVFNAVTVSDSGSAAIPLSLFNETVLSGNYSITIASMIGAGTSNTFSIVAQPLNVTLSTYAAPIGSTILVGWLPTGHDNATDVYLLRLSSNHLYTVATNISDTGSYHLSLGTFAAGAYKVAVTSPAGTGLSAILEITSPLNVTATPSNVSTDSLITITWAPFDSFQSGVTLSISNASGLVFNASVPNSGSYGFIPDLLNISIGNYVATISSNIGTGNALFIVYGSGNLNVTQPNVSSFYYTNSTNLLVQWSPTTGATNNVTINLVNINTSQIYQFTASDNGSVALDISVLHVSPGLYEVFVISGMGSGVSARFPIFTPVPGVHIYTPNSTTVLSNVAILNVTWLPTSLLGQNATILLFQPDYPSIFYGPFNVNDNGLARIDLLDQTIINKNLIYKSRELIGDDVTEDQATLSPKEMSKKSRMHQNPLTNPDILYNNNNKNC